MEKRKKKVKRAKKRQKDLTLSFLFFFFKKKIKNPAQSTERTQKGRAGMNGRGGGTIKKGPNVI